MTAAPPGPATGLAALDAVGLRSAVVAGEADRAGVTSALLARIRAVDGVLRSVIAVDAAAALHHDLAGTGPLAAVPVLVKDNVDTVGPMGTTAGSTLLSSSAPGTDAPIVTALRRAGAPVLGKANLSEWANFRSSPSSSGWSAVGGQGVNPHALDRSPGGSSSGSAAAVAAGLAPLAVGTETDGSICCPAALCGVVGIKPTVGLVPRTGIVPVAAGQDTAGPIARSVRDAALLLGVLADVDDRDPATLVAGRTAYGDYLPFCDRGDLRGVRVGLPRKGLWGYSTAADDAAEEAVRVLAGLGASVVDPADIPTVDALDDDEMLVLCTEIAAGMTDYLATRPGGGPRTLAELISGNRAAADVELAQFGQELFERAAATGGLHDPAYLLARSRGRRRATAGGIDAVLRAHGLDALVAPTCAPAWKVDLINGDHSDGGCSTVPAVAGYPIVTVPCGMVSGLPLGLAFMGTAWSEPTLIALAAAYEGAAGGTVAPAYRAAAVG